MGDQNKYRNWAAWSYVVVLVVIGLPLFWYTTDVYRASLPYTGIRNLDINKVVLRIRVNYILLDKTTPDWLIDSINQLNQAMRASEDDSRIHVVWGFRVANKEELQFLDESAKNPDYSGSDLDGTFTVLGETNMADVSVYLVPPLHSKGFKRKYFLGTSKNLFVACSPLDLVDKQFFGTTLWEVDQIVTNYIVGSRKITWKYQAALGIRNQKQSDSLRSVKTWQSYSLTFTLAVADAKQFQVDWDTRFAIKAYLDPFLKRLSPYITFKVTTQVLYMMKLDLKCKLDEAKQHYVLESSQLPHIINPLESRLGSRQDTDPQINFVVYIPSTDQSPLQIYNELGEEMPLNSLLVKQWGGINIFNSKLNISSTDGGTIHRFVVDSETVMGVFVEQLRSLLEINSDDVIINQLEVADLKENSLHQWELDSLIRIRLVENVATSIATLISIADLLSLISNMVISDQVAATIAFALNKTETAMRSMRNGDLVGAYESSIEALSNADKAFFDPSMLALLYFPDDQKFAIYVPLFVPVGIPVLGTLLMLAKFVVRRKKPAEGSGDGKVKTD